ncbi:MAG: aminotransferase class V-fold PLP-dependent enzyme [Cyclobacteriaceae bacterium]|nr:aminotransferase class V-fold PLP-dependent enzyme [Cyclobacteriaceae bacterium]
MNPKINFTPGPSQLYFTVEDHVRQAFKEGVPSLSHRSKKFEAISQEATEGLRELLGIMPTHHIYFTGSANEIWERIIQNLVETESFHFVNGAFSKRFYEIAQQLHKAPRKLETEPGNGFSGEVDIPSSTELIALTHNETSTGVTTNPEFIYTVKEKNQHALIAVDAVSSLPYPSFNYSRINTAFFSVQKGFGLPAGLGVWIADDACLAKAESLLSKGISIGSFHNLPTLHAHAVKNQTPETPNVLGIYLLGKVIGDMQRRGIDIIRKETEYKAAILYQALDAHPLLKSFVQDKNLQSKTVIVAECGVHTEKLTEFLIEKGLYPGDGYGSSRKNQLRFANFPTHSKEQYELLVDSLEKFAG